jgi:Protein of unknown function (DUF2934)
MNKNIEKSLNTDTASVSRLAYQLWENAGRPAGRDLEFWLEAEAKLQSAPIPSLSSAVEQVTAKQNSMKSGRSTKGGVKKTWPKPYPNLPKF